MDLARVQVEELKAEVEFERRLRRKAESLSRALALELSEERAGREATEKVCEELADALLKEREEMGRVIEEVEEERRMMRVAEVMREERVRMTLSEAKMLMEEKLREMEEARQLRDSMGVSLSVTSLYGEFDFGMELADADFARTGGLQRRVEREYSAPSSSFSSSCYENEKGSLACKDVEYNKAQLRMLLMRDKDSMLKRFGSGRKG